jgi:hypothetical protein
MCRYLAAVVRIRLRYLLRRAYPGALGFAPHSCGQSSSLAAWRFHMPAPEPAQPVQSSSTAPPSARYQRIFVAEITCLLCARPVGTVRSNQWPPIAPILLQPADSPSASTLAAWWRVRCTVCGGNTAASEVTTRTIRIDQPIDWRADPPRRGRPPKWLVEGRRNDGPDAA